MLIPRRSPHVLPDEHALLEAGSCASGDFVGQWEGTVAEWAQMPHAIALNSGRLGMTLILRHLGVGAGDEVVVPSYTLGALIPLVQSMGATPVPADVDLATFNVTAKSVAKAITPRTKAVMALHAFGAPAPVEDIAHICEEKGIPLIEDCAHALGAKYHGTPVGSFGYAGFFSFEITKPVNTYGGGMVVTRDDALAGFLRNETKGLEPDCAGLQQKVSAAQTERMLMSTGLGWPLLLLLTHPLTRGPLSAAYRRRQQVPSGNAAYSPQQARLGLAKWQSLPQRTAARTRLAALYRELLKPAITLQKVAPADASTWYFLVALVPGPAERLKQALLWRGIDCAAGEEIADDVGATLGMCSPNARHLFRHALALPLFDGMEEKAVRRVAKVLNDLV